MGKKLFGAFLFALLLGISPLYAKIHFPFFGHHHKSASQSTQMPSELARADEGSPYKSGWDTGYRKGYDGGQADHNRGAKFDADDAAGYKSGHPFCESLEGKGEHQCRKGYRLGFKLGYQDGYSGLQSRLITSQESTPSQAVVIPEQAPSQPESPNQSEMQNQSEQPSAAVQENPESQQPSTNETAQNTPRALPKTASNVPLFGLIGLAGIALSLLSRAVRKATDN